MPSTKTKRTLLTCDEFEKLATSIDGNRELVDGEVIELSPAGMPQGELVARITIRLGIFCERKRLGRVLTNEIGMHVNRARGRTRGGDVAFISYARLPADSKAKGFLNVAPELVVEVLGEDETWDKIQEKVADYHGFGVDIVWAIDPEDHTVRMYPKEGARVDVAADGKLTADALPGFELPVADLFES